MKGGLEDPNLHYPLPPIPPLQHLDVPRSPARLRQHEAVRLCAFEAGRREGSGFPVVAFLRSCRVIVNVRWHASSNFGCHFLPPHPVNTPTRSS